MKFFARFRSRGKQRSKLFRYGWKITLVGLIAGAGLALLIFYGAWAASFDTKKVGAMPERNTVFDVDGKIYSRLAGSNRLRVSLDEVSPLFIDALLAREDTRFYQHPGVDWRGILRALVREGHGSYLDADHRSIRCVPTAGDPTDHRGSRDQRGGLEEPAPIQQSLPHSL